MKNLIFKDLEKDIDRIVRDYVKIPSITETEDEVKSAEYMVDYLSNLEYFKENSEYYGLYDIEGDYLDRKVSWGMLKGKGSKTIVMIHHNDVVSVEDFNNLKEYAFNPNILEEKLKEIEESLSEEVREDLNSGDYLFGRGVCDMKGGGSIQLALLNRYSQIKDFKGNIIVIGVPDEENLSAGMRAASLLLNDLKEKYNLDYKLMIDSEPHQREDRNIGLLSTGSIGKVMPFVYVKGFLAHAGKIFEGFNPLSLLGRIMIKTEVNMDFSDRVGGEATPPPTWLYFKDNKEQYDVSIPMSASGAISILTFDSTPGQVMDKMRDIIGQACEEHLEWMNDNYIEYLKENEREKKNLDWNIPVLTISELMDKARAKLGFEEELERFMKKLKNKLEKGEWGNIEGHVKLVDFIFTYIDDLSPMVIYGLTPPFYPNVANINIKDLDAKVENLPRVLNEFTKDNFGQEYDVENFYTGISDLSYANMEDAKSIEKTLKDTMPLFGSYYRLPLKEIENISMPTINIGPWGKDFHKMTERVLKEDLYIRTPMMINRAVEEILLK